MIIIMGISVAALSQLASHHTTNVYSMSLMKLWSVQSIVIPTILLNLLHCEVTWLDCLSILLAGLLRAILAWSYTLTLCCSAVLNIYEVIKHAFLLVYSICVLPLNSLLMAQYSTLSKPLQSNPLAMPMDALATVPSLMYTYMHYIFPNVYYFWIFNQYISTYEFDTFLLVQRAFRQPWNPSPPPLTTQLIENRLPVYKLEYIKVKV